MGGPFNATSVVLVVIVFATASIGVFSQTVDAAVLANLLVLTRSDITFVPAVSTRNIRKSVTVAQGRIKQVGQASGFDGLDRVPGAGEGRDSRGGQGEGSNGEELDLHGEIEVNVVDLV